MHDPEPIDLSPLDPERDPQRWALLVQGTRRRVAAALLVREREPDPLAILAGWARPVLAAAAAALLLLGFAGAALDGPAVPRADRARRLALLAESAVVEGRTPTGAQLMAALEPAGGR